MSYRNLYKLPIVPHPRYAPTNRALRRPLIKEMKKHNEVMANVERLFLLDLFNSDRSYAECFADLMDSWKHELARLNYKYTVPNEEYTRIYQPSEFLHSAQESKRLI